jgi:hypothetical protein
VKKKYDIVAKVGTYKNSEGEEKNRNINIGSVFQRDDNSFCMKLDSIPVSPDWSGWLNLYEPRKRDEASAKPAPAPSTYIDEDAPF